VIWLPFYGLWSVRVKDMGVVIHGDCRRCHRYTRLVGDELCVDCLERIALQEAPPRRGNPQPRPCGFWHRFWRKLQVMKKAFILIELVAGLVIVAAILVLSASAMLAIGGGCSRSEGIRFGVVTKFSYQGIWKSTKSWEGDLAMEGISTSVDGNMMANIWHFSVLDAKMAAKIEPLIGKKVKVHYDRALVRNPLRRSTQPALGAAWRSCARNAHAARQTITIQARRAAPKNGAAWTM